MLTVLVLSIFFGLLLAFVAAGVGIGLLVRSVAMRNRVHPAIETGAPLTWTYSPGAPARLHRRLQSAVTPVYPADAHRQAAVDATVELAGVLAQQAAAIDRELINVNHRRGASRRAHLRRLRAEVRQLEALSQRLEHQRAAVAAAGPGAPLSRRETLDGIGDRLDRLAEAHAELRAIEQASTASDPDEVLSRIAPRPPAVPAPRRAAPFPDARHASH